MFKQCKVYIYTMYLYQLVFTTVLRVIYCTDDGCNPNEKISPIEPSIANRQLCSIINHE